MILLLSWLAACTATPRPQPVPRRPPASAEVVEKPAHAERFRALPAPRTSSQKATRLRVELGEKLFNEPRLASTGSCAACHDLKTAGASPGIVVGHAGQTSPRSVPSVFNSALQEGQFWDGRAPTVEVASATLLDEQGALTALAADPAYVDAFDAAFPFEDPTLTGTNLGMALGAYLRGLLSPGRFDRYLAGEVDALTTDERAGLDAFVGAGCASCHFGQVLGGNIEDGAKIPTLRNVTRTGPWFQDGRAKTLDAVFAEQHGGERTPEEIEGITRFLGALEGSPGLE